MHNGVRLLLDHELRESVVLLSEVKVNEADVLAGLFLPNTDALTNWANWGQRVNFEFKVDLATAEVVHNDHFVTDVRKVQSGWPTAESVAT